MSWNSWVVSDSVKSIVYRSSSSSASLTRGSPERFVQPTWRGNVGKVWWRALYFRYGNLLIEHRPEFRGKIRVLWKQLPPEALINMTILKSMQQLRWQVFWACIQKRHVRTEIKILNPLERRVIRHEGCDTERERDIEELFRSGHDIDRPFLYSRSISRSIEKYLWIAFRRCCWKGKGAST